MLFSDPIQRHRQREQHSSPNHHWHPRRHRGVSHHRVLPCEEEERTEQV